MSLEQALASQAAAQAAGGASSSRANAGGGAAAAANATVTLATSVMEASLNRMFEGGRWVLVLPAACLGGKGRCKGGDAGLLGVRAIGDVCCPAPAPLVCSQTRTACTWHLYCYVYCPDICTACVLADLYCLYLAHVLPIPGNCTAMCTALHTCTACMPAGLYCLYLAPVLLSVMPHTPVLSVCLQTCMPAVASRLRSTQAMRCSRSCSHTSVKHWPG
jgi:hypothetical protein